MKILILIFICFLSLYSLDFENKAIVFTKVRVDMTKEYMKKHYNLENDSIKIVPRIIVIHHTGVNSFEKSFNRFYKEELPYDRPYIAKASSLNVSVHYLVDKDGTIYNLMPDNIMARHVIGLNYSSIGIENVGGEKLEDNLSQEQLQANMKLIKYLKKKYKTINDVIGHYEYKKYENDKLWLEKDSSYRTIKNDPSKRFMKELKDELKN